MTLRSLAVPIIALVLQGAPPPRELAKGDTSNIDSARQVVVRTPADWDRLWRQHDPEHPAPKVDFAADMVLAIFSGSRPTPGYAVNVVSVTSAGDDLFVRYRETRPAPGTISVQILTFPFQIVLVPARPGRVTFESVD